MKTQSEIRSSFWDTFPEFQTLRRTRKRQNDYPATVRSAFVEFVDGLERSGTITPALANRVTL